MPQRSCVNVNPMDTKQSLSHRFRSRTLLFGAWTSLAHPTITEIFARSGVDFVGIDMEHSTIGQEQAQRIIAAAHAGQTACLPRVASHNGEQIRRLLDSGADGIIVPNVSACDEIERIVEWSKYPPVGKRSYGVARAQGYGFDFDSYTSTWNDRSVVIAQIESRKGVEAIDQLLENDYLDGVMIGPYDISGSLGIPGQLSHPKVTEACIRVAEACQKHGKACGTQLVDPTQVEMEASLRAGYSFVVLASDIFLLWKWSASMGLLVNAFHQAQRLRSDGH